MVFNISLDIFFEEWSLEMFEEKTSISDSMIVSNIS